MTRLEQIGALAAIAATALLLSAAPALAAEPGECVATPPSFDFCEVEVNFSKEGAQFSQAGGHPDAFTTDLAFNTEIDPETGNEVPVDEAKDLVVDVPPGLVLFPTATPRCSAADFLTENGGFPACPDAAAIGLTQVTIGNEAPNPFAELPVYNLVPVPGKLFRFGFLVAGLRVTVDAAIRPTPPYNGYASIANITQQENFYASSTTLWGFPASPTHDEDRGNCAREGAGVKCPAALPERALITMPRSCGGPLSFGFAARPWGDPESWASAEDQIPGMLGCEKIGFEPRVSARPSSASAESATGLDFAIEIDDPALTGTGEAADSDLRKAVVTLPEGMTANPSVAAGLQTCSPAQYEAETLASTPGQGCPQASKLGTVEVKTPLLEGEVVRGEVFLATPEDPSTAAAENPFDSLLALYMVLREPRLGLLVKLPGKVEPQPGAGKEGAGPGAGRLITTFGEPGHETPQLPFSDFHFRFHEGAGSPLITPPACGAHRVEALLTPWANPDSPYPTGASFEIERGVGGGPCPPAGRPPFAPGFEAGSLNNHAGSHTPFTMRLTRRDGDQDMTRFDAILPPGVTGKLAGVAKCGEAQIAAAEAKSGRAELRSPSCPSNSEIGDTLAGAGVGAKLTYVPGRLYLAGPFAGAPLSVVAITPAVAGPFDVGTVVVRQALDLDPVTAEVQVDGSRSDPIPHVLKGIPLKLRDLRVNVDRDKFVLNPTSCKASSTRATLFGGGSLLAPLDDAPVSLSARFQAAGCAGLAFKPRLALRLRGGTGRGAHPAFQAVLRARPGDANLRRAVVKLPRSAFLEQAHIRTICTRVQFAADSCPPASIYGTVTAFTPLLEEPLRGPAYLRSSDNELPDLVFALRGLVEIEAAARIDSVGGAIRASFPAIPDAPVSKVVVRMQGGRKGLIVNSRNLCAQRRPSRARVELGGQNGKASEQRPPLLASCAKQGKRGKKRDRKPNLRSGR